MSLALLIYSRVATYFPPINHWPKSIPLWRDMLREWGFTLCKKSSKGQNFLHASLKMLSLSTLFSREALSSLDVAMFIPHFEFYRFPPLYLFLLFFSPNLEILHSLHTCDKATLQKYLA